MRKKSKAKTKPMGLVASYYIQPSKLTAKRRPYINKRVR